MYSDGSRPWVSNWGEAKAAGKGGTAYPANVVFTGGKLTLSEANDHYRNGNGVPVVVTAGLYDFTTMNPNGFNPRTGRELFTFPITNADFYVNGTVTLQRNPGGDTFRVLTDTYDFDMHSWTSQPIRNTATLIGQAVAGQGTPYQIIFVGKLPIPPPAPPIPPKN